jgi:hypothetical protein
LCFELSIIISGAKIKFSLKYLLELKVKIESK